MSTQKHTPGPWHYHPLDPVKPESLSLRGPDDEQLAAVYLWDWEPDEMQDEARANARLIASAPQLLEALEICYQQLKELTEEGMHLDEAMEVSAAAIAMATGATPR
jgi:hypothetical protein